MRRIIFANALIAFAISALPAAAQITPVPERTDWTAPAAAWWSHVQFLADDKLEGRRAGTPGYDKAVAYVEQQFQAIGLKPAGTQGYQQSVALVPTTVDAAKSSISLKNASGTTKFEGREVTLSPRVDSSDPVSAPLVFIGYGLRVPSKHLDDFAGTDLKGKVAVFYNAPPERLQGPAARLCPRARPAVEAAAGGGSGGRDQLHASTRGSRHAEHDGSSAAGSATATRPGTAAGVCRSGPG